MLDSERMCAHPEDAEAGPKGTKDLLARYGGSLLCVRYRFDEGNRESLKTVELVVRGTRGNARQDALDR